MLSDGKSGEGRGRNGEEDGGNEGKEGEGILRNEKERYGMGKGTKREVMGRQR